MFVRETHINTIGTRFSYNINNGIIETEVMPCFENDDENIIILRILMLTICSGLFKLRWAVLLIFFKNSILVRLFAMNYCLCERKKNEFQFGLFNE